MKVLLTPGITKMLRSNPINISPVFPIILQYLGCVSIGVGAIALRHRLLNLRLRMGSLSENGRYQQSLIHLRRHVSSRYT